MKQFWRLLALPGAHSCIAAITKWAVRVDDQCLLSVGPEGLEPSPTRLRAGNAAANTFDPVFHVGTVGVKPTTRVL